MNGNRLDLTAALDPGRSVAVTASAGSGKTWLLVSRIVRLLLEGQPAGGILALTFTRKAAAEMRERVGERLRELAYASDIEAAAELERLGLPASPHYLAQARGLYESLLFDPYPLRAMTLHAFCQDLLTRFALEAGVSPGFALAEAEHGLYRRAWRRLLAELHQQPGSAPAQALRTLIAMGHGERALENLVFEFLGHRADWWAYVEGEEQPLQYAAARLRAGLELDQAPGADLDGDAFNARLKMLLRWQHETEGARYLKAPRLEEALNSGGEARYRALLGALFRGNGTPYRFQLIKARRARLSEAQYEHFEEAHREVVRAVEQHRDRQLRQSCLQRSGAALELGTAALRALEQELAAEQALTFADLEWRSYRLLRGPGNAEWIRYKLDQKIDHLLIDEFQDTSPTQWLLLLPFLEEMAAGDAGRSRSVFIVGDAKQSIYGFRRANPELLGTAARWLQARLDAVTVPLNDSRRSAPAIVDFVNALFEPAGVGAAIGFERHDTWRKHDWGRVEAAPLVEPALREEELLPDPQLGLLLRDPLSTPRELEEASRAEREGRLVAQRIRALVESGVAVRGEHGNRAIEYGDVMVLARSRTHLQLLEQALTAAGIPYVGSSRGTLLDTAEARDLVALLRFLNAPHRDLELAQVLRSPLFSLGDDCLVALATTAGGARTWFEALAVLAAERPELRRALQYLERWRPLAAELPAHDLLDRIYSEADVAARYEAVLPAVAAARVRANLGAFIQLALEADSGRYPSLARFLDYLRDLARIRAEAPDESPPPAGGGQVRVMTIHAAKGLEAPAVFLVNSGRVQAARTPPWLIEWPSTAGRPEQVLVPGPSDARDPLSRALAEHHAAREAREDLNLLYVAATRARQFLHVSGFRQGRQGSRPSWHELAWDALRRLGAGGAAPLTGVAEGALHYGSGEAPPGAATARPLSPPADDARLRRPLPAPPSAASAPSALGADGGGEAAADPAAARRGQGIHALLQWLSEDAGLDEPQLHARLQAKLQGAVRAPEFGAWLAAARATLAAPELARFFDPARYRRAWNEVPYSDGERSGSIDRLVDDGATLWILDYKTATDADEAALAARYRPQLLSYASALRRAWPQRELRAGLVLTEARRWVELGG
ncbi:MAG TPA: UvrD-helicase domain-containing protein [Nevskia sp.]|nr:UvrD-helicase domain-containing protein [Nevskia sp.]